MSKEMDTIRAFLAAQEDAHPDKLHFLLWRPDALMPVLVSATRENLLAEAALMESSFSHGRNAQYARGDVMVALTFTLYPKLGQSDRVGLATAVLTYLQVQAAAPELAAVAPYFALITDGVDFQAGADTDRERFLGHMAVEMEGREHKLMPTEVMEAQVAKTLSNDTSTH